MYITINKLLILMISTFIFMQYMNYYTIIVYE